MLASVFPPETAIAEKKYLDYLRWVNLTYLIPGIDVPRQVQLQLDLLMAEFMNLAVKTGGIPPVDPIAAVTTRAALPRSRPATPKKYAGGDANDVLRGLAGNEHDRTHRLVAADSLDEAERPEEAGYLRDPEHEVKVFINRRHGGVHVEPTLTAAEAYNSADHHFADRLRQYDPEPDPEDMEDELNHPGLHERVIGMISSDLSPRVEEVHPDESEEYENYGRIKHLPSVWRVFATGHQEFHPPMTAREWRKFVKDWADTVIPVETRHEEIVVPDKPGQWP
jgi:uncharacterized protein (TIGR02996 family)